MRRSILGLGLLLGAASVAGCSDSGSPGTGTGGQVTGTGGASTGGSSSSGGATAMGGSPAAGTTGNAGTAGGTGFAQVGVCGQRGKSTVSTTGFEGYEEFYLIGEEGLGSDICVVHFDVKRVGEAPSGCTDCKWTHLVEYSNPMIVTDVDGVCGKSELGFSAAKIAATAGSRAAYGYVSQFSGHNSVLMKYGDNMMWDAYGNATWEEPTSAFRFDRRNGFCGY